MRLEEVRFPVYVVHTDEVFTQDGILWCADAVVDDKNVSGDSIGQRRLRTPLKNLYDLKYQINTFGDMIKHRGKFYVDSNGKFFAYEKSKKAILKYHKINKIESKDVMTLIWIAGIPFPFEIARPPLPTDRYAGILYINNRPSFIYEITDTKKKNTWRKI
tara:strand:- start:137 stop:616 length:480 start_codon:yes stop_codon:yes gene_type:complete